jgi:hypothetical protein
MIEMHVYLPEKYMSHFLMEFFFSQKFESLIVSFGPVTWPGWLDLAGLAGPSPAHVGCAGPNPKNYARWVGPSPVQKKLKKK